MSQAGSWFISGGGGGSLSTLTGNSGGSISPIAGNINIVGVNGLTISGNNGTATLSVGIVAPIPVSLGGTGDISFTPYAVVLGGTTSAGALQTVSGLGTAGQVLVSNGAGAAPTWQNNIPGTGIVTIDGNSGSITGTTVTIEGGNNIATSGVSTTMTVSVSGTTTNAVQIGNVSGSLTSIAVGTTGQVLIGSTAGAPAFGALGLNSGLTAHGIILGEGASAFNALAPSSTAGALVASQGSGLDPAYLIPTAGVGLSLTTNGTTLQYALLSPVTVSHGGTGSTSFTVNGVVISGATSTSPLTSLGMSDGQVIIGSSTGAPAAATLTAGSGINIVNSSNSITISAPAAGMGITTIDPNTGAPVTGTTVGIQGGNNITTSGAGSLLTLNVSGTTNNAVQIGNSSGSLSSVTPGTTGQVLIGSTGSAPAFGALGVNSGLTTHGILLGEGNSAISALAPAATPGALVASQGSSSDPAYIIPTAGNGLSLTSNATTLQYALSTPVSVANGGTGSTLFNANGVVISGSTTTSPLTSLHMTNGQLIIGSTSGAPAAANLTAGSGITITNGANSITISSAGSGSGISTIDGNFGSVTGGTVTISGGTSGAVFTGSGTILTESFNYLSLPNSTSSSLGVINIGGYPFIHGYPTLVDNNTFIGRDAGNFTLTGINNVTLGAFCLNALTSGNENVAISTDALSSLTTGIENIAIGHNAGALLLTGSRNVMLGTGAGLSYTTSESNNIILGNHAGTVGESGVTRIGINGSTTACYIDGIDGVNVGSVATVVTESGGQLGTAVITAGTGVTIVPTANAITINATGSGGISVIDGDTGSVTGSTVTITSGNSTQNSGSSVAFVGSGSVLTLDVTDSNFNTIIGNSSGNVTIPGNKNTGLGYSVLSSLTTGANSNVAIGPNALTATTTGFDNISIGDSSLLINTTGQQNIAIGVAALGSNTTGSNIVAVGYNAANGLTAGPNTAIGDRSMQASSSGTNNVAVGEGTLTSNTNSQNTAVGSLALTNNTSGTRNTAVGSDALYGTTTSSYNVAMGYQALYGSNTAGGFGGNTAIGSQASQLNTSGGNNVALGYTALQTNTTGSGNTALGYAALYQLGTGTGNTAIGNGAGSALTSSESNNVYIGSGQLGVAGESFTTRIGLVGTTTSCYIAGINGVTVTSGTFVYVDSSGQLGTVLSSRRYKDNIEDMGDLSSSIMDLRPVTFTYNTSRDKSPQVGLIAEEVNEVMPRLVIYNDEGSPETVKYQDLPILLLNEMKKLTKRIEHLENMLASRNGDPYFEGE